MARNTTYRDTAFIAKSQFAYPNNVRFDRIVAHRSSTKERASRSPSLSLVFDVAVRHALLCSALEYHHWKRAHHDLEIFGERLPREILQVQLDFHAHVVE